MVWSAGGGLGKGGQWERGHPGGGGGAEELACLQDGSTGPQLTVVDGVMEISMAAKYGRVVHEQAHANLHPRTNQVEGLPTEDQANVHLQQVLVLMVPDSSSWSFEERSVHRLR